MSVQVLQIACKVSSYHEMRAAFSKLTARRRKPWKIEIQMNFMRNH